MKHGNEIGESMPKTAAVDRKMDLLLSERSNGLDRLEEIRHRIDALRGRVGGVLKKFWNRKRRQQIKNDLRRQKRV